MSILVSLGLDHRAWHRGGTQMFTEQIYMTAMASASESALGLAGTT